VSARTDRTSCTRTLSASRNERCDNASSLSAIVVGTVVVPFDVLLAVALVCVTLAVAVLDDVDDDDDDVVAGSVALVAAATGAGAAVNVVDAVVVVAVVAVDVDLIDDIAIATRSATRAGSYLPARTRSHATPKQCNHAAHTHPCRWRVPARR
jgi:hypothetical protein